MFWFEENISESHNGAISNLLGWHCSYGDYYFTMKSIGIKDLKNNLSSYLEFVKKGETIIVYDRNNPIAEIKKILKTDNRTDLYIKEATENNSLIPAKKFKEIKFPKVKSLKGISRTEISNTWKTIYNEERE